MFEVRSVLFSGNIEMQMRIGPYFQHDPLIILMLSDITMLVLMLPIQWRPDVFQCAP